MVTVYEEHPEKLNSRDSLETIDRQYKLLDTIISKSSREEIIGSIIEEKVRSIFYGNPLDYFLKDSKTKLGFGNHFKDHHSINLEIFCEITARRNLYAHNAGRVDSKYIREVKSPAFTIGRKAIIDKDYLRRTIIVLRGISAVAGSLVIRNVFNQPKVMGTIATVVTPFETYYSDIIKLEDRAF
ncbi:hypothetical protein [Cellvibrio sp. OA-2007]|uniref:hypothetical protein n=1 Tax=Cellvibrio sp. OA-2007 TaxID=529823 RepID=UPI000784073C|nr:hypothetical protein [Cellvibrio sp. OA-2007]